MRRLNFTLEGRNNSKEYILIKYVGTIAILVPLQYFSRIHNAMGIKDLLYPSHYIDGNTRFRIMHCVGLHRSNAMLCRDRPLVGG